MDTITSETRKARRLRVAAIANAFLLPFLLCASAAHALGTVTTVVPPSRSYCDLLPTANADDQNLRAQAAAFPTAFCGKYRVSCPDVDDMNYFTLDVPAERAEKATVVSLSGSRGRAFHTENVEEYAAAGLQVVAVAYEMDPEDAWPCARNGCPEYQFGNEPGVREASCRPATIVEHYQTEGEALCAQGHSSGSSALGYTLAWNGGADWLDYVQLTGWNPMSRMDYGCDPDRYNSTGTRDYGGETPSGRTQIVTDRPFAYDSTAPSARQLIDDVNGFPDGTCGEHPTPGLDDRQAERAFNDSLTATGADYRYPDTVIDHYACVSPSSMTDGNGSWWLEETQAANHGRIFTHSLTPGTGENPACTREEVWWRGDGSTPSPIRQLTIDRMLEQCVLRH